MGGKELKLLSFNRRRCWEQTFPFSGFSAARIT
jgi:hypothetical protein